MRFFRRRSDADHRAELDAHLEFETERLVAKGMSRADATAAARRAFGNVTVTTEMLHAGERSTFIEQCMRDVRYGLRAMRRSPAFTAIAIICLGVGISVNTAAFSFMNAMFLREFPGVVNRAEIVAVQVGRDDPDNAWPASSVALSDWLFLRDRLPGLSGVAAVGHAVLSARATGESKAARVALVSGSYFPMLGSKPALGRLIAPLDDQRAAPPVVVITRDLWERTFAGRADVVGQPLTLGTHTFTVIGVAPDGFFGLHPGEIIDPDFGASQVFIPLSAAPLVRVQPDGVTVDEFEDRWLQVIGRIPSTSSAAAVSAQANQAVAQLALEYPRQRKNSFARVQPADAEKEGEMIVGVAFVMAVPVIILLVACANLANQLLARAVHRAREIALRLALGATRARIVRQLFVETALLSLAASCVGMLLARWVLDIVRTWYLPTPFRIPIDLTVLVFTVGLALLSAVAFGLAPALRATRRDLVASLKDGAAGGGLRPSRLRGALVVVQIAASLALITVASVFVHTADRNDRSERNGQENQLIIASTNLDLVGFDSVRGRAYQSLALERVSGIRGVRAAGMSPYVLYQMPHGQRMREIGADSASGRESGHVVEVSGEWFAATDLLPVRGRLFSRAEMHGPSTVAVVDEAFARRWWGTSNPIGRVLRVGGDREPRIVTIVGVVPAPPEMSFREPEGALFLPGAAYGAKTSIYIRASGDASALIPLIRKTMAEVDARVPVLRTQTAGDVAASEAAPLTMVASGLRAMGGIALALAALGLFGVLTFVVAQRQREIGIRVALGARKVDVTWMVLRQSLTLAVIGVIAGSAIATAVVIMMRSIIHGLPPVDPIAIAGASMAMVVVALIAGLVPARRALRVDPMVALHSE